MGAKAARGKPMLRVATYNIHRAVGADGRLQPERTARVVLSLDADLVALQEVEMPALPSTRLLLSRFAAAGYRSLLGPTIGDERHGYGNVLLSRLPLLGCDRIDLSVPGREPRGLVDAHFGPLSASNGAVDPPLDQGRRPRPHLRCLATHLGLSRGERQQQIARIAALLDAAPPSALGRAADPDLDPAPPTQPVAHCRAPTLLLGDFNEWLPSRRLCPLDRRLRRAHTAATWHARWPLLALDRVWYRGLRLHHSRVRRDGAARLASDHLPLLAQFEFLPP